MSGDVTVMLSAVSMMGIDEVHRSIHIEYDGVTNFYHTPYLLDLINSGSQIIPHFQINVTERFFRPGMETSMYRYMIVHVRVCKCTCTSYD